MTFRIMGLVATLTITNLKRSYAECRRIFLVVLSVTYSYCYAGYHCLNVMLSVIILSVAFSYCFCHAQHKGAERRYAEFRIFLLLY